MDKIGHREVVEFAGYLLNEETLIMNYITMAIVILIAVLASRNLKEVPTGWQNAIEAIAEVWEEKINTMIGPTGRSLTHIFLTLFVYLVIANWLGLFPTLASPTNDLNTTLGLALLVIVMVHTLGLKMKGGHYIAHFFQPTPVFVVINAIEEVAKPITLSFRLFGNILAGEILIIILLKLMPIWMPIPSVIWLAFSIFIGGVQAFIFTMLSMAYFASAVGGADEEEGK